MENMMIKVDEKKLDALLENKQSIKEWLKEED
jgi:hypothetical protein